MKEGLSIGDEDYGDGSFFSRQYINPKQRSITGMTNNHPWSFDSIYL